MTRAARRRGLIPAVAFAALLAILLLFVANVGDITLGPGEPAASPAPTDDTSSTKLSQGLDLDPELVRHLLFAAFTVSLIIVLVSAMASHLLRRWLYFTIGLFGAILAFDFFCAMIPPTSVAPVDDVPVRRDVAAGSSTDRNPTDWSRALIALGLSVGAGALLVAGSSGVIRYWQARRRQRRDADLAQSLEDLAGRATAPDSGVDVVVWCYHEMLELLSDREQIRHDAMTAREFADCLRELGLPTAAVDRLTRLFELVRYGHRDGGPLADRAAANLDAIRRADAGPPVTKPG